MIQPHSDPIPPTLNAQEDPLWSVARGQEGILVPESEIRLLLGIRDLCRDLFLRIEGSDEGLLVKEWHKAKPGEPSQGGGVMSVLRGKILEKAAVNISVVAGPKYPALEGEHAGKPFTAAGVSLICHPSNPNAPIAHMNVRILSVGAPGEQRTWIGGGADLTPMLKFEDDTSAFHGALRDACESHRLGNYPRYRDWCDEYFFLPHRGETRGVGGIFFDYLTVESSADLDFLERTGKEFARVYGEILARRVKMPFDAVTRERQLHWRGRYAEFNLVYDRGTRFGLLSGGNVEAIFASLPPIVKW